MSDLQSIREHSGPSFNKGMTLEQYMANLNFGNSEEPPSIEDEK